MPMELAIVPFETESRGPVLTFAFRPTEGANLMSDVAIVGIGMHAFGRHPITGREQGAIAARRALEDAGIDWSDVEYAFGGSSAAGAADTLVATSA